MPTRWEQTCPGMRLSRKGIHITYVTLLVILPERLNVPVIHGLRVEALEGILPNARDWLDILVVVCIPRPYLSQGKSRRWQPVSALTSQVCFLVPVFLARL